MSSSPQKRSIGATHQSIPMSMPVDSHSLTPPLKHLKELPASIFHDALHPVVLHLQSIPPSSFFSLIHSSTRIQVARTPPSAITQFFISTLSPSQHLHPVVDAVFTDLHKQNTTNNGLSKRICARHRQVAHSSCWLSSPEWRYYQGPTSATRRPSAILRTDVAR